MALEDGENPLAKMTTGARGPWMAASQNVHDHLFSMSSKLTTLCVRQRKRTLECFPTRQMPKAMSCFQLNLQDHGNHVKRPRLPIQEQASWDKKMRWKQSDLYRLSTWFTPRARWPTPRDPAPWSCFMSKKHVFFLTWQCRHGPGRGVYGGWLKQHFIAF